MSSPDYPLLELMLGEVPKAKVTPPAAGPGNLDTPLEHARPLILNFGAGVDSTAMSLKLLEDGIRPELFIFADTGGEKPETIEWKDRFGVIMSSHGWPDLVTVQYEPVVIGYRSLLENCIVNKTLPSLAFGRGGCSIKWKHSAMDRFIMGGGKGARRTEPWPGWVEARELGVKPTKLIGYDNGPKDSRRKISTSECDHFFYRYPLREEWKLDREGCQKVIRHHGLVVPPKSSCFFCPAMQVDEVEWLFENHPDLFLMALWCEAIAMPGLGTCEGLWRKTRKMDGRSGSWLRWAEANGVVESSWRQVTQKFRPWNKNDPVTSYDEVAAIKFTKAGTGMLEDRGHDAGDAEREAEALVEHCEQLRALRPCA